MLQNTQLLNTLRMAYLTLMYFTQGESLRIGKESGRGADRAMQR